MNRTPDSVELIEEWLSDGPDVAPDRVLAEVTDRLITTRQERGFPPIPSRWRKFQMTRTIALATTTAAIVIVLVVGAGLLNRLPDVGGPTPTASSDPSAGAPSGQLAYHATVDSNTDIYLANADGTGVTRLTTDPGRDMYPAWSPNGESIAFIRAGDLFVMAADGSDATRLTSNSAPEVSPSFTPDGAGLIFGRAFGEENWAIHRIDLDGANERLLYREETHLEGAAQLISDDVLVVTRDLIGGGGLEIARVDLTTNAATVLTDYRDGEEGYSAVSSDGSRIAYHSEGPVPGLHIMDADGTDSQLVTDQYFDGPIAWSADGSMLSFSSSGTISLVKLDGGDPTPLLEGEYPAWRPES